MNRFTKQDLNNLSNICVPSTFKMPNVDIFPLCNWIVIVISWSNIVVEEVIYVIL